MLRRTGLARALSKLGLCSRSQAAKLIRTGQVTLNGSIRRDPETPVRLGIDKFEIAGTQVRAAPRKYVMLNKPRDVITTADDEKGRRTVYDYLPNASPDHPRQKDRQWIAPVGRLDKASEGLLLLTNDSEWAARITAPESHLNKTYHVQIAAIPDQALLERLGHGIEDHGERLRAKRATVLRQGQQNSWLEIILDEGKNRQIRRMFSSLGIEVLRLVRVAIGPLALGDLAKGAARPLTAAERSALDQAIHQSHT